jgi:hypothetical protein
METRDTGYVHARSGAALALLRLGRSERAGQLAEAELADVHLGRGHVEVLDDQVEVQPVSLARGCH